MNKRSYISGIKTSVECHTQTASSGLLKYFSHKKDLRNIVETELSSLDLVELPFWKSPFNIKYENNQRYIKLTTHVISSSENILELPKYRIITLINFERGNTPFLELYYKIRDYSDNTFK